MLRLRVLKGPDTGKTQVFHSRRVTLGDDGRNDFELTDTMVSRFHGVFETDHRGGLIYRDLTSLNGSFVRVNGENISLRDRDQPQEIHLRTNCQLAMGQTLIEVVVDQGTELPNKPVSTPGTSPTPLASASLFDESADDMRESIVRRVAESPDDLTGRISTSDNRIQALLSLARELNAINELHEIYERVSEVTFDLFPLANFFCIAIPEGHDSPVMSPDYARQRGCDQTTDAPVLSQSLLQEVVKERESVLYVRDNMHTEDTRKSIVMAQITACLAAPLFGQKKLMGVMQVDSRGRTGMFGYADLDLFTVVASSTAFAMERARLNQNMRGMFEAFVYASVAAIDSRDPTTAGHSQRVADYTILTATEVNRCTAGSLVDVGFSQTELTELHYAALLHDFGKIGVREEVLQKANRLMPGVFATLMARMQTAMVLEEQSLMAEVQAAWQSGRDAMTPERFQKFEVARAAIRDRYQRWMDMVRGLQSGRRHTDVDKAMIKTLQSRTFVDAFGVTQDLLTEEEAQDLLIPWGTLNIEERRHIESHAGLSFDYLSRIPWGDEFSQIPCIAGRHHEKLDGTGYPNGLNAELLSYQVRILTVCDIFDALTATDRPYKKAKSVNQAIDILRMEVDDGKLDADVVDVLAESVVPQLPELSRT